MNIVEETDMRTRRSARRRLIAFAAILSTAGVLAAHVSRASEPGRLELAYEVYSGGFHVVAFDLDLALAGQSYDVTARIRTTGMLSWFMDWRQVYRSTGAMTGTRIDPFHHRSEGAFRGRPRRVEMAYSGGEIAALRVDPPPEADGEREEVTAAQRRGSMDPVSAILALVRAVSDGRGCATRVAVFDGRRRYDMVFTDRGPQPLRETRYSIFSGAAQQCDFVFEPIAGYIRRRADDQDARRLQSGRAWLAPVMPGAPAAPVRVELDGNWGLTVGHLRDFRRVPEMLGGSLR
jgi:hypothetical protein